MDLAYDVIVIGAGIMGLSTAMYCQKSGLRVLLLEQFSFPHTRGSSHGQSRITRMAYQESPVISQMMRESHELWREIENESQMCLLIECGMLYVERNPAPKIKQIASVNDSLGYKYELLDSLELGRRYGCSMQFPDFTGLLDLEGGLLRADACCHIIYEIFRKHGGHFIDMSPVVAIKPGSTVEVTVRSSSVYRGRNVVVSMGPWAGEFMQQLDLDLPLTVESVTVCYWKAKNVEHFCPHNFPCFIDISNGIHALPSFEYPGLVKMINPVTNERCGTPDLRDVNIPTLAKLGECYAPYLTEHFSGLEISPSIVERCMYTKTPDYNWIVDRHQNHKNIILLAGFSGHGFKAGPLIGKIASEFISGPFERYDLTEFSISRFSK